MCNIGKYKHDNYYNFLPYLEEKTMKKEVIFHIKKQFFNRGFERFLCRKSIIKDKKIISQTSVLKTNTTKDKNISCVIRKKYLPLQNNIKTISL